MHSGQAFWVKYLQNSSKRMIPPPFLSTLLKSWRISISLILAPEMLRHRLNSSQVSRRSLSPSTESNSQKILLKYSRLPSSILNSFLSTQSSPSPALIVALYARIRAGLWLSTGNASTASLSISARETMLFPLKSMRLHSSLSFPLSLMTCLIFFSQSSNMDMDFFVTKCAWVALWPWLWRITLPQCSPETMSAARFGFDSGFTRFLMYAQNSTKRTCPPWLVSILLNSSMISDCESCSPSWLSPRLNSLTSIRRSSPSMVLNIPKSLLNQKMFRMSALNSFFSTQSSPSPSTRMVFLYARISAGLLLSQAGHVPPATNSTTILSISARLTMLLPL
mmetsp:Transcript_102236/g.289533  ORF Transcript_102236/g.289533 Transcript_102236/m.289533 type:complete len:336 (+) Transcript_102236:299-1306(+)